MRALFFAVMLGFFGFGFGANGAQADQGYYRFPALSGDTLVFTAEGDLWTVPLAGGRATRLTTHLGQETRAAASPEGKWIAFNGAYDGPSEVYVMALAGGLPKRVTFEAGAAQTLGWTSQGEVIYATQGDRGPASQRVIGLVDPQTLKRRILPLADVSDATLSADGNNVYFTRFGLSVSNDNVRFYRGGLTSTLWRYDLKSGREAEMLKSDAPANDRRPMLNGDRLIVISDRDGRDNLWSMALDGSDRKQLTRHKEFDIRAASLDKGRIVYQLGADIHVFDLAKGDDKVVPIDLATDFLQRRQHVIKKPLDFFESARLSPKGDRVAIVARGKASLAALGVQRRVDVATQAQSRLKLAAISPDGKSLYGFSDQSGESELWRFATDGSPEAKQLTKDAAGTRNLLEISPDGKWIAHGAIDGRLFLLNLESGQNQTIDQAEWADLEKIVWSPDSKYLVLSRAQGRVDRARLVLYALASKAKTVLTSDKYESGEAALSTDGKWLYFLSNRQFQSAVSSPWGDRNLGPYFDKRTKIYALALQPGLKFPFQPPTEADAPSPPKPDADKGKDDKPKEAKPALPEIELPGLAERLFEVPLPAGNFTDLALDDKRLYVLESEGAGAERRPALKTLAIESNQPKPELFMADVQRFELSADRKKILIQKWTRDRPVGDLLIVDAGAKAPTDLSKADVKIGDWSLIVTPADEWRHMFQDAWRMHRDFFYDKSLKKVDWPKTRDHFAPLLDRLADRADLDDVLGQMMAELGTLHSQVIAGDQRAASDGSGPAFLGAIVERESAGFKIAHIYQTEAELPSERGPLSAPGTDVREGDIITAINGRDTAAVADIAELLRDRAGQQVLLGLKRGGKDIKTVVTPVDAARNNALRYGDWEEMRRAKVDKVSQGRIGYVHLRAMGPQDIATFAREFYANIDRDGVIIDVRRNNGGNIDSWVIEKLLRKAWAFWQPRYGKYTYYNMQQTFRGHVAVLIDERTYSDGETFAAGIKALKLAPLIGKRTSGAGVWLSDRNPLTDRGRARVAELAQFSAETGEWLIEGKGVSPDIEVDNLPHATFTGADAQLDAAIANIEDRIKRAPIK